MINRIYFILILVLSIGTSNANPYSVNFTVQDVEKPEIEECIEALSKGFMVEENIYERFNLYQLLYDDSYYSIIFGKSQLPERPISCSRAIYKEGGVGPKLF